MFIRRKPLLAVLSLLLLSQFYGCAGPQGYLQDADRVAYQIIAEKQEEALGKTEPFTVMPPSEALRKRLLSSQNLPYSHPASLGIDNLAPIPHWPDVKYQNNQPESENSAPPWSGGEPYKISLIEALQIAARNSREYQSQKEEVFRQALALDLERDGFRHTFTGLLESLLSTDLSGEQTISGSENSANATWSRRLKSGVELTSAIAIDLVKLLSFDRASSLGILADASISIPLLRGAGRHIVAEPLTQAERDTIYAIYRFERFKRTFAVQVTSDYLSVLALLQEVSTAEEDYKNLLVSANRSRRLADAGRISEIEVDQAIQNVLRARDRWFSSILSYESRLDSFKITLGLPTDASIELDKEELSKLAKAADGSLLSGGQLEEADQAIMSTLSLKLPDRAAAIPLDLDETEIMSMALANRLDLRINQGQVYDKQRKVVVASNGLLPELTILGTAQAGDTRSIATADEPDAKLRPERGFYSALLSLDLPFERTAERNAFRNSVIDLELAVRDLQDLEDKVKLDIRQRLRDLAEFRERIKIQSQAVSVARRRVTSTSLFLEAGRAQMRDLLEAQEALVQALNSMNGALVDYRVAEVALQRDMGVLEVDSQGLYQEYHTGEDDVRTN